jgi:2-haloacid dehalogenase
MSKQAIIAVLSAPKLLLWQVMFIAAHLDDTHGAKAAGLRTLYVDRSKEPHPPYFSAPDHTIDSLADLGSVPVW